MRWLALSATVVGLGAILWLALETAPTPVAASTPTREASTPCEACHTQDLKMTLPSGETMPVKVDTTAFTASAHGSVGCTACHAAIASYPHPAPTAASLREYRLSLKDACQTCHADAYAEMSMGTSHAAFNMVCTDCHNPHYTPEKPKMDCDTCHAQAAQTIASSAHAQAAPEDMPACTDCHTTHRFDVAPTRAESLVACSTCHANNQMMAKYGLSGNVVQTYLRDFHGKTATLESQQEGDLVDAAVCSDCHGAHDVQPTAALVAAGGETTCQKCHPGTDTSFASAWLSHTEPSPSHSPLVFLADWFYRLLIPFIVIGLVIHIGIDLRRAAKEKGAKHDA